jgi:outer membrane lipoprotein-sorting protein
MFITIKMFKNSLVICLLFIVSTVNFTISVAFANSKESEQQNFSSYKADLIQIENYLNNISHLSSDFIQELDNQKTVGKFYLSRNGKKAGKMRIEYLDKPKILVVVNGAVLHYQDIELDEISSISTNATPASFLTRPKISFNATDIKITNIVSNSNEIEVSLIKKNRPDAGEFTLIFSKNPWQFIKMQVKNELEQKITVYLNNIKFNENPNSLFIIKSEENST